MSDPHQERAAEVLGHNPHLAVLSSDDRACLLREGALREVPAHNVLCEQHRDSDRMYLVVDGTVVVQAEVQGRHVALERLGPGDVCGENSALFNVPCNATARVLETATVLELPRDVLREWESSHPVLIRALFALCRQRILYRALRAVALLNAVPDEGLARLADQATLVTIPQGEPVVREGEPGDGFYVVLAGTLVAERQQHNGSAQVGRLAPGDYFGEWSVLTGAPRSGTVRAETRAEVVRVDTRAFLDFIQRYPHVRDGVDLVAHNRLQEPASPTGSDSQVG